MTISMSRLGRDGQLGNQLFQYAMLRAVATKRGFDMKIPKNFNGVKMRDMVELERFYIEAGELGSPNDVPHKFKYDDVQYNPDVFTQADGTDYQGWYQSEKYFADIAPQIRREFRFHCDIDYAVSTFINEIRNGTCDQLISLHVRRGDYTQNPDKFRVLAPSYYEEALFEIEDQLTPSTKVYVLVFSDDLNWCRSNLKFKPHHVPVFVNSASHWHDMCTMSKCDHHVISASTFSWWGAWLNPSDMKIVVVPKPWFGSKMGVDTTDLIPEGWTQLETMEGYL